MVVASYLLCSTHIRYKDDEGVKFKVLPNRPTPNQGILTPSRLKDRVEQVLQMIPKKLDNLVIINSTLSNFEMIQTCVEVADKFAENVTVIPSLLALLTYAVEDISRFRNPPANEVILVVILTNEFLDFVILRRDQSFKLCVAELEHFQPNECKEMFPKFYDYYVPDSTTFIVHEDQLKVVEEVRDEFQPEMCFISTFDKFDFLLMKGGLFRAMSDEDGFDTRYHIANFSSGYEAIISNRRSGRQDRHVLLPERSSLPCNIYGINGITQPIKVYYSLEYHQQNSRLVSTRRDAIKDMIRLSGSSKQVIGFVDDRGVPFSSFSKAAGNYRQIRKSDIGEDQSKIQVPISQNDNPVKNDISAASDAGIFLHSSLSGSGSGSQEIKFIFRDNFYAVEILQNGVIKFLTDSYGNEWIPLYLSMADGTVEIGEKARNDYKRFSKYVIYDVFKIIGKPSNEIQIDPRWGFEVIETDGIMYFQVETQSGPRLIPQETVIAAFLKAMKLQTQSFLNAEIAEIRLSTTFKLSKSQKVIFQKAAAKNNLEIFIL